MTSSGVDSFERLALDTTAYSHMNRGHDAVLDLLARAELVMLPMIAVGELEAGFDLGSRKRVNHQVLNQFLEEPFVTTIALTRSVARIYGRIFGQLRRAGTPIPVNDVWIAAMAIDIGAHLLTFDTDFQHVEALDCTILSYS